MKTLLYKKTFENKDELKNIFIPTGKQWNSTENEKLSIIESGNDGVLYNKMINDINEAKVMICLQSFLIQDTQIIEALLKAKQERDVNIYIMDSAEARLNTSGFEEDESFATKDYIKMLEEKFKNNFIHRQANNLHAKFILIDPKTNPKGYIFTGNFNEKPFFNNPELAISLSKLQTVELFKVFVFHFWEHTTDEQTRTNQFDKIKPAKRFSLKSLKHILITSPEQNLSNLKETLINAVSSAEKEIIFSTFGFDINNKLSNKILEKLKSGIKVTVFCRPREKAIIDNIEILAKNGAKVICHPLIHAKSLLVDDSLGYLFTANFENHGLETGFEIGVELNKKQTNDLIYVFSNWEKTFPYNYKYSQLIKDTTKYSELNSINITKIILPESTNKTKKSITNTNDLIITISNIIPKESLAKRNIEEVSINLNEIDSDYNVIKKIDKGIELIEYKNIKKKNTINIKAILIDIQLIDLNDGDLLQKLNDYRDIKIFAK